ncbi:MAG TPA: M3 family metallopeptidase, partial [Steroidobacteraceae bacterium]|nr:M3 family metallopeptidase [Steroidobacteraceae bacterium]
MSAGAQAGAAPAASGGFGPSNPFYKPSTLPFHAPPFDKIKDADYQPAIEAGMAAQLVEIQGIAENPAAPTFENTLIPLERSGQLLERASAAFNAVTGADINPLLQQAKTALAPKLAAHRDAVFLNGKLFARVSAVYKARASKSLDPESVRLVEFTYDQFVHSGANLSDAQKARLKMLNEEASTLSDSFTTKLLAANKDAAYATDTPAALAGLSEAQIAAAAQAAQARGGAGYVLPLQNTTQQPALASLSVRATREAIFANSWNRAEHDDANDTRATVARLAQLRAQSAQLLGYPSHAAWKLEDQMAKTPQTALEFMDALVPLATAKAASEGKDIEAAIDSQGGGFALEPWDWDFYAERVRKAKFDLDDA